MIEVGPGAGDEGGRIVVTGAPREIARKKQGRTAPYLDRYLRGA
jgi:excinuclease ABC subunit A